MANALSLATKSGASRRRRRRSSSAKGGSSLQKAQSQVKRLQNKAKLMQAATSAGGTALMNTGLVAAGSGACAWLGVKGTIPAVANIDGRFIAGGVLTAFGVAGAMSGKGNQYLHASSLALGNGMLAGLMYEQAHNWAVGGSAPQGAKTARFGRDVYVSGLGRR